MKQAKVIISTSLDPWKNLSIEEFLVTNLKKDSCVLYLWKNDKTVVIGKNQNPWRECNIPLIEKDGVKLSRRITGGGAVYHGLGNLNFSFVMNKGDYDLNRQLKVILDMCSELGIDGELTGRNDLTVNGRKFSGNAFYHGSSVSLHHGTLLINENMSNLAKYLKVSKEKMSSKGVTSVKSRVSNLATYYEGLSTEKVTDMCIRSFINEYSQDENDVIIEKDPLWFENEEIKKLYEKNASWDWRYGRVPEFQVVLETRLSWGEIQIHLNMKNAIIKEVIIYSDCLDQEFIDDLPKLFIGQKYNSEILADKLRGNTAIPSRKNMLEDIAEWIENKMF
ncbi:lipoate--protein ligase [Vallitalea longa]|uniref:lipoate--protein ligase n=1 Tax=Vallitalea longa TaxID=2936439 RepID=A0A9W5YAX3_9FIRM|nr:lipoate--protein ligase [Vallitalea longa]GKX27943.1 lipoate--protein ligase [Vallitalea longa]